MDIGVLREELLKSEYGVDAAKGVTVDRAQELADLLNKPTKVGVSLRKLTTEEVLDALGAEGKAEEIAALEDETKTEAVALGVYLYGAGGMSMAEGSVARGLLQVVVSVDAFTRVVNAASVDVYKSRAEVLGLGAVGDGHVLSALEVK